MTTSVEGPLRRYRALVAAETLKSDDAQRAAVEKLELLHRRLMGYRPAGQGRGIFGVFGFTRRGDEVVGERLGLYMYGGVGRGKSMLMDLFYDGAPVEKRRRVHFHAFMQEVHGRVNDARAAGATDPIAPAAAAIADSATLLCFDEMQVTDIADAMILGRLFEALFARGVVVVATSNRHPRDLYKDGLNRQLFTPFIAMLEERLDVHHLDGPTDFRLARMHGAQVYHAPLGPAATKAMDELWSDVAGVASARPLTLMVMGREVVLPRYANGVGRARFSDLCEKPLGASDYLAIVGAVRTLFLDEIPHLSPANFNAARRFVTLVDALYEAKTHLICSAAAEPDRLYPSGEGAFEFERTASRLMEMRSADWIRRDADEAATS